jgi:hypothetical protein
LSNTLRLGLLYFGAIVGPLSLVVRTYVTLTSRLDSSDSLLGAVFFLLTFFTVLTNLMMALCYVAAATKWSWLEWWDRPFARGLTAGSIAMVSIYYIFFLSGIETLTGINQVLNIYMHYVAPWLFVLWWLLTPEHGSLRLADLPKMLVYPLAYLVVVLIRGAVVHEYPYPILNVDQLGYGGVAIGCLGMVAGFVVIYAATIGIDRWLGRRTAATA